MCRRATRLLVSVLAAMLVWAVAFPAVAADDEPDPLANVTVHPDSRSTKVKSALLSVWRGVRDYADHHGLSSLPRFDLYIHDSKDDAAAAVRDWDWDVFDGLARSGSAHVLVGEWGLATEVVAHEAFHIVQFEVMGHDDPKHACLSEGGAEWFGRRHRSGTLDWDRDVADAAEPFTDERPDWERLDRLDEFQDAVRADDVDVYTFCFVVFDLLERVHGRGAYFDFLKLLGSKDWRAAFEEAFSEPPSEFSERLDVWFESGFTDWTTAADRRRAEEAAEAARQQRLRLRELLDRRVYSCNPALAAGCIL